MNELRIIYRVTALILLVTIVGVGIMMTVDWLWMRPTFCTEAVIAKDYGGGQECENVHHKIEWHEGSPVAVCRCP